MTHLLIVIHGLETVYGLTLERIISVIGHVVTRPEYEAFMVSTGLPLADAILITLYTTDEFYSDLNRSMRYKNINPNTIPYINGLVSALRKLPDDIRVVYRGLGFDPTENHVLTFNSFVSFSRSYEMALMFYTPTGVLLVNEVPVGGKYIAPISMFPDEEEVLFGELLQFEYIPVINDGIRTLILRPFSESITMITDEHVSMAIDDVHMANVEHVNMAID